MRIFCRFILGEYSSLLRTAVQDLICFASNALTDGTDIKTLPTLLDHVSNATTLNPYSQGTDEMRQKAAVKIDQGIAKVKMQKDTATVQPKCTMTTFQARKRWSREAR